MTQSTKSERLLSIDALRGFDMFWIIGGDALYKAVLRWSKLTDEYKNGAMDQMEHVEWAGFRFYDLIFPLFLFLVGVVIPYSLGSLRARGQSRSQLFFRIARRTLLIFAFGLIYNNLLQFDWANLRWAGVLQRIALCYGAAAILAVMLDYRGLTIAFVAILLGYWLLFLLLPVPSPGGPTDRYSKEHNISGYVDRAVLRDGLHGKILEKYYGYGDNEGLLSTIPAVATALLGVLAGIWLRMATPPMKQVGGLVVAGISCLVIGWGWGHSFPIIKNLWTSSFVLVAGGWSLLLLALFYLVIDVGRFNRWAFFFIVIGANAITIYMAQRIMDFGGVARFFSGGLVRLAGDFGPVLSVAALVATKWLFLCYLYRQKIFLRA